MSGTGCADRAALADGIAVASALKVIPLQVGKIMKRLRGAYSSSWPPLAGMADDMCRDQMIEMLTQEVLPSICELTGALMEEQSARVCEAIAQAGRVGLDDWERMVKTNEQDRRSQAAASCAHSPPRVASASKPARLKAVTKRR